MAKDGQQSSGREEDGKGRGMFSREGLDRLAKLNRSKLKDHLTTADKLPPPSQTAGRRRVDRRGSSGSPTRTDLESLCPGRVVESPQGVCYVVERSLEEVAPEQMDLQREYDRTFNGGGINVTEEGLHPSLRPLLASMPSGPATPVERIAYLDIETCGMIGMTVFLVGLLTWREGRLVMIQFLARDYSEERAMLARSWDFLEEVSTLVTFNGLTFDVPYIEDRVAATGLRPRSLRASHVDMLHESRRRWRGILPNCRLQTLERFICGRLRRGDIPGDQIPSVYHEFVRTKDARQMAIVLHHNALDLLTLAELVVSVLQGREVDGL